MFHQRLLVALKATEALISELQPVSSEDYIEQKNVLCVLATLQGAVMEGDAEGLAEFVVEFSKRKLALYKLLDGLPPE